MNIKNLQENVPLAPYTTFKIGGPAKYFVVVKTAPEMAAAVKEANAAGVRWYLLGGGSDTLIADAGVDGLVIKTELREVEFNDAAHQVRAGSGVQINALIHQSFRRGLTGLEFAIGVPATVGGAVWANLGARGSEIKDVLLEVTVLDELGRQHLLPAADCGFGYRESRFKDENFVILDALFQLQLGEATQIKARIKELAALRQSTQDVTEKSAGCIFKNPIGQTDQPAAKLIDRLGLKGKQIGGAKVSERHANFIINTGGATADEVVQLISYVKQQVRDKEGVQLMEEVHYLGFE